MATKKKKNGSKRKSSKRGFGKIIRAVLVLAAISALIAAVIMYIPKLKNRPIAQNETETTKVSDKVQNQTNTKENPTKHAETENKGNSAESAISGTWISSINSTMLTLSGNTYTIDFMSVEATPPMNGTFSAEGDTALFFNDSGKCGDIRGVYRLAVQDNVMVLETIQDDCPKRAASLDSDWKKLEI